MQAIARTFLDGDLGCLIRVFKMHYCEAFTLTNMEVRANVFFMNNVKELRLALGVLDEE